jgi:hypothetical protein
MAMGILWIGPQWAVLLRHAEETPMNGFEEQ